MFDRLAPLAFVAIWSTGFIVARLIAPHADPLTFVTARFVLSALVFAGIALAAGAAWPRGWVAWRDALTCGVLLQAAYIGGVFWSVRHGLLAALAALVGGLQPLMTAMLSMPLLGEPVGRRRWFGIAVGFTGALLVIAPGLGMPGGIPVAPVPVVPVLVCFGGIVAFTLGTILQKRTARGIDLRTNAAIQFLGAAAAAALVAWPLGDRWFDGSSVAWIALLWAVAGLSVVAISLLLLMIRRGAVASVASLFYLVPPVAAVIAYFAFGDVLAPIQVAGMVVAAIGVALANRP